MMYLAYEAQGMMAAPMREAARWALTSLAAPRTAWGPMVWKEAVAAWELIERAGLTHKSPAYGIESVQVGNRKVPVAERAALRTPFGTLLHFAKDTGVAQPRVMVVAPLSG